jgi:phosphate transport system substrate-binding protein
MSRLNKSLPAFVALALVAFFALTLAGCGGATSGSSGGSSEVKLQGAGSSFANPLYQKWFSEYIKAHPNLKFDYQSIGSGGGIKQFSAKTVDFGGSDAPMTDDQIKGTGQDVIHVPIALGAIVLTYNLPEVKTDLKLTPEAVAGIFLGSVKKWNDPAIAASNSGVNLPASDITVVHRSDGSGTTYVFVDYLSKVSPEWKEKVGVNTSVNWPVGVGAKGNEGVTGQVKQTPNSIGYVELIYAEQNQLPHALLKNSAGQFVKGSLDSVTAAAAASSGQMPDDMRISITNAPGQASYPISAFTYALVYKEQPDQAKGKALVDFLWWATHDGQSAARELHYAPLAPEVVQKTEQKLKSVTYQGKPLLTT